QGLLVPRRRALDGHLGHPRRVAPRHLPPLRDVQLGDRERRRPPLLWVHPVRHVAPPPRAGRRSGRRRPQPVPGRREPLHLPRPHPLVLARPLMRLVRLPIAVACVALSVSAHAQSPNPSPDPNPTPSPSPVPSPTPSPSPAPRSAGAGLAVLAV